MPGPDIWGPHGWKFIHYITLGYPNNPTEEQKKNYYDFFIALSKVIPCSVCANHFKQHLEITPLDNEALKDKESLMAWGIKMHNHVNAKNGKKIYSIKEGIEAIIKNDDKCIVLEEDQISLYKKYKDPFYNSKYKEQIKKPNIENFKNNTSSTILTISIILNLLLILYLLYKLNN
jgi:hypothetical protein